jgi:hypothetical protein
MTSGRWSKNLHSSKGILQDFNATFLTLIPKIKGESSADKFHPIYLCNIIYKIISKLVATRLKPILPLIISQEQGGFVEGRKILDGIIVAHETIHSLKISKKAGMMMKLDMSKAYDRMNWDFLIKNLLAFGFEEGWVTWVMNLVTSAFFSILLNGSPTRTFNASRGLRQGDPLSPFLYIILAEGLGRSLSQAKSEGMIKGLPLIQGEEALSHLQFVDDNLLMGSPMVKEVKGFKSILDLFNSASSTVINQEKSQLFFFNTPPVCKDIYPTC